MGKKDTQLRFVKKDKNQTNNSWMWTNWIHGISIILLFLTHFATSNIHACQPTHATNLINRKLVYLPDSSTFINEISRAQQNIWRYEFQISSFSLSREQCLMPRPPWKSFHRTAKYIIFTEVYRITITFDGMVIGHVVESILILIECIAPHFEPNLLSQKRKSLEYQFNT